MRQNQKKKWKTILFAGILAGLTLIQPIYGADFILLGANRIIRIGENGSTTSYTPNQDIISNSEQQDQEPGFSQTEEQKTPENPETNSFPAAELTEQQEPLPDTQNLEQQQESLPDTQNLEQQQESLPEQPAPNLPAGIRPLDPSRPMIALTYDDGPQSSVGNRIMNVMNQYGGKCTFFMVGNRVNAHADEVRRIVNEGFEVANHTQDHKNLSKLNAAQIQAQVTACSDIIQSVCGVRPALMRLPGGNKNNTVLASTGMPIIMWNVDTKDWKTRNAQSTINAVLGKAKDGDIILMHELYTATAEATETLVPELTAQGFQLVTVSELAYYKGTALTPGQIYYSIR